MIWSILSFLFFISSAIIFFAFFKFLKKYMIVFDTFLKFNSSDFFDVFNGPFARAGSMEDVINEVVFDEEN